MPKTRREGEDRIITVPNALTALRLACLPVFVALMTRPNGSGLVAAAALLAALGVSDGLDGYIARHFDQVSSLGKVADPLVDRVLVLTAIIATVAIGAIPVWLVVVVLTREALVLAGSAALFLAGAKRIDVSWAGKAGTFGMMVALPLFIVGHAPFRWHTEAEWGAWVAAAWGLALGWYAVIGYLPRARAAVAESRREGEALTSPQGPPRDDGPVRSPKYPEPFEENGFERASTGPRKNERREREKKVPDAFDGNSVDSPPKGKR
jgi:cardiolipin synthase